VMLVDTEAWKYSTPASTRRASNTNEGKQQIHVYHTSNCNVSESRTLLFGVAGVVLNPPFPVKVHWSITPNCISIGAIVLLVHRVTRLSVWDSVTS